MAEGLTYVKRMQRIKSTPTFKPDLIDANTFKPDLMSSNASSTKVDDKSTITVGKPLDVRELVVESVFFNVPLLLNLHAFKKILKTC
jgi:hypothetical protein